MKKILKLLGIFIGLLFVGILIAGWVVNEPLPEGKAGPQADALAQKMLNALNYDAYKNVSVLKWSFRNGANQYVWNKNANRCQVSWDEHQIELNLKHPEKSTVKTNGEEVTGKSRKELIQKAVDNFNNDSFWLVAPYKVFDTGTERKIVALDDGATGLLVTYTSGGTTPGDSYLWVLNDDGFPAAYKMWVKIIPVGGLKATWDDWVITQSGAYLPKTHQLGPLTLNMGRVSATK